MSDVVARAAAALQSCCDATAPSVGIVLGSGLHGLVSHIEHAKRVPFSEILDLPGHPGAFVYGLLCDREIVAVAGRMHLYEDLDPALPIQILAALGIRMLLLTNAAGGIRPDLTPGTFMLLTDYLDLTNRPPDVGGSGGRSWGVAPRRRTDQSSGAPRRIDEPRSGGRAAPRYDAELATLMREAATAARIPLAEGVYAAMLGPSYETAAEIRMLATLGADAVGMSTVPETIAATALGLRVGAISCITNHATGTSPETLSHADVLGVTSRVAPRFERLIRRLVSRL